MISIYDLEDIKKRIADSNSNASRNRNLYPIQEQATLMELWKYLPCECDESCTCKKFGCSYHWNLKEKIAFDDLLPAFIRMFVDKGLHERLTGRIRGALPMSDTVPKRVQGALSVLKGIRDNWNKLYSEVLNHNKSLVCDNWYNDFWRNKWNFQVRGTSVYIAKQFCILLPDICIPYDTLSREKILNHSGSSANTYFGLLNEMRKSLINTLQSEYETLPNFRKLDSPQQQLPFNSNLISLRRESFNYGDDYTPSERPISRIVDKYFYQPGREEVQSCRAKQPPITSGEQELYPLTCRGKPIFCKNIYNGRHVVWGNTPFDLLDEDIDEILDNFFQDFAAWYKLGASETKPIPGGFGEYVQKRFPRLTPRHASAIASIMVQDNLIEFRGRKPIELRKLNAE